MLMRCLYPAQGMLHPAEVAVRRIGEQPAAAGDGRSGKHSHRPIRAPYPLLGQRALPPGAQPPPGPWRHSRTRHPPGRAERARPRLCQCLANRVIVHPQVRRAERHVLRDCAARPGELPDAVDRVVIVIRQDQAGPRAERVCLPDKPGMRQWRSGWKSAAYSSGGALKCARTASRARSISSVDAADAGLCECGLPKHRPRDPLGMRGQLRQGWQACAGVVEVDVPSRVEVGVVGRPQLVKQRRAPVAGVCRKPGGSGGRPFPALTAGTLKRDVFMTCTSPASGGLSASATLAGAAGDVEVTAP